MPTFEEIQAYTIRFDSGGSDAWTAAVFLAIADARGVWVRFYPPGAAVPPNRVDRDAKGRATYFVALLAETLEAFVDTLRFEKPVFFTYDETSHLARVTTSREPVGEQEGVRFHSS